MATGDHTTPIAIIGMGCRFSGNATSPEKLWDMLVNRENGWSQIPECSFGVEGLYHPNSQRVGTVRWPLNPTVIRGIVPRMHIANQDRLMLGEGIS